MMRVFPASRRLLPAVIVVALVTAGCGGSLLAPDSGGTFLIFNSDAGDWVGGGQSRRYTVDDAVFRATIGQGFGQLQLTIDTLDRLEYWRLHLAAPAGEALLLGTYEPVIWWTPALSPSAQMDFSGDGRSCGSIGGRFTVRSLKYGPLGEVEHFHATFEQTCTGSSGSLTGEIRIVDGGAR